MVKNVPETSFSSRWNHSPLISVDSLLVSHLAQIFILYYFWFCCGCCETTDGCIYGKPCTCVSNTKEAPQTLRRLWDWMCFLFYYLIKFQTLALKRASLNLGHIFNPSEFVFSNTTTSGGVNETVFAALCEWSFLFSADIFSLLDLRLYEVLKYHEVSSFAPCFFVMFLPSR